MKKILLSIFFAFCFFISFGQNIINRSGASVTIADARLQATLNLLAPRYADTTAANASIGIDSCGAVIFTYDANWYWIRQCSPKRWSLLPTITGSLNTTVNIVDSNHISICTINSCDTIQVNGVVGPVTNITIINNSTLLVCGSDQEGPEQISNGAFAGSAAGWTLGTLWAYGTNNIEHSFGSTATSFQGGGLVEGGTYVVELDINGGTTGTVAVSLDAGTSQTYNANAGSVTFTGTWNAGINSKINFAPSNNFDGSITNVSVKQLLPNCDTLQIVPGQNFLDSVIIYARSPLYAENDTTFAIRQAGRQDSGYLSKEGYDSFYQKVDTIYFANNGGTVDTLKYDAGDLLSHPFYINDVQNGLISGGQVSWSGFGFIYTVEQAIYRINGVRYTSPPTTITLDPADATNPRTDVIGVDTSGNAVYIPGVAEANPVTPQVNTFYQIFLTSIDVPATATVNPIDTLIIYDENLAAPAEWTPVTNIGTTTDPDNTLNVYRGVKSINLTNMTSNDSLVFTTTVTDISGYSSVVFFIKLKEVISTLGALRAIWVNGNNYVSAATLVPIDRNNITTYQAISMPLSSFGMTSSNVTSFRIVYQSANLNVNQGFFIDFVYLQNGVTPTTPSNTLVAYNGLTNTRTNNIDSVRLGGTLNQNTTINTAGFPTTFTGSNASPNTTLTATTLGTSHAFVANATSGNAVNGIATSGRGVYGLASSGIGGFFESTSSFGSTSVSANGIASSFLVSPVTTSTVIPVFNVTRSTTGTAANGLGGSVDYYVETSGGTAFLSNQLISRLTDATTGTRTSEFSISGVNSTTTQTLLTLAGTGAARLNLYGTGIFTGTATRNLAVDVNGNIIEVSPAGGVSADNGLNISSGSNVQLGGTLLANTTIGVGSSILNVTGNTATILFQAIQSGAGNAIGGFASGGSIGVIGQSTSGTGVLANATTSGIGLIVTSVTSIAATITTNPATTNTVAEVALFGRNSSGTPANGIGGSIGLYTEHSTGTAISNSIQSKWVDVTAITRTSQMVLSGVLSAVAVDLLTLNANGSIQWRGITATEASAITAADGMQVYVTTTNGTFTAIGFWARENGAWVKM